VLQYSKHPEPGLPVAVWVMWFPLGTSILKLYKTSVPLGVLVGKNVACFKIHFQLLLGGSEENHLLTDK
jgi:hypothetical protein